MTLTEAQILKIVKDKSIGKCSDEEKAQVFSFMFGDDYMKSNDKGAIKDY